MFNRVRAHPLWPVRRAFWVLLVVGGVPALAGGLAVGACLCAMASGRGSGFEGIAAGLAAVFLLMPGLIHLAFAVPIWRARAWGILGAAAYSWILLGLLGLAATREIRWLVFGPPGIGGTGVRLTLEVAGMLALMVLLWCLRAAGRCLRTRPGHGFEVILPGVPPLQTGYPTITPPAARGR